MNLLWRKFHVFCQIFLVVKAQILKNYLAIWSPCSLSLSLSLSFFHTLTLVSTNKEGKKIFDEKQQMAEKFSAFKAIITFCFKVLSSLCFSIFLFHRRLIPPKYFFLSLFVTFHFSQNISIFHSMACVAPLQSLCSPTIYLLPTYDPLMKSHLVFCYFHFFSPIEVGLSVKLALDSVL